MALSREKCVPCHGGVAPLSADEAAQLGAEVPEWSIEGDRIVREFEFKDFAGAIRFINVVAQIAEDHGHHPDIHNYYNRVRLELTTHAIKGLTRNDFVLASVIDEKAAP
jgi:4a-hydroxytetrahydrobiopterin dehydratase